MNIAVCDDDKGSRDSIAEILQANESEIPDISVSEFSDGLDLVECYQNQQRFDLVLLDVEMPGLNGIQAGKRIREIDKDTVIVFLTNHEQYVFNSLHIEIFDYIIKPPNADIINNLLSRVYRKYTEQHHIIKFNSKGAAYSLDVNDVVSIESYNRQVKIYTTTDEYECKKKLNDFEKHLLPYGFLRCHQGFLVNMKYIVSIDKRAITTSTDHDVHMSARKRQDCLKAYNKYIARYVV